MKIFAWLRGQKEKKIVPQVVDAPPLPPSDYCIADHLVVTRLGNSHHGLYSGEGRVIFYNYYSGVIVEAGLQDYAKGNAIKVVYSPVSFKNSTVMERARSRIGEREHNLYHNNNYSEQFVRWARGGGLW
ncbi:lecithin retinol acyltransferase family protein [Ammoniphilus sp. YIM 78166]|uniref:lecithin retinol acyltransferase family protein n=1 Tax=Ammoniphilus sp. YIM 78166 TaxID=1644106 RepID=UPI00106F662E|nr:lecithin retinol acyltransferase family protein [Ammoniphilus sp. YIM 78166]